MQLPSRMFGSSSAPVLLLFLITTLSPFGACDCYFPNGTLATTVNARTNQGPCAESGNLKTICCALNRDNGPGGNRTNPDGSFSMNETQDECLPNGVCRNRFRVGPGDGEEVTSYWIGTCTEKDWKSGKCMDVCPGTNSELTPCDGTSTSEKWCCGGPNDTSCCDTNPVVIAGTFKAAETSSVRPSGTFTASPSSATAAGPANPPSSSNATSTGLSDAAKAGIGVGAAGGIAAVFVLGFFVAKYRNMRQMMHGEKGPDTEFVEDGNRVYYEQPCVKSPIEVYAQQEILELSSKRPPAELGG